MQNYDSWLRPLNASRIIIENKHAVDLGAFICSFFAASNFHVLHLVNDLLVIFNLAPRHFLIFSKGTPLAI